MAAGGSAGRSIGGLLSRLANWLFCRLSGCQLTDATTGIKMFTPELFDRLGPARPVRSAGRWRSRWRSRRSSPGLQLGEVPIVSIDRLYGGKSTFALGPWTVEYLRWFIWGFRQSLHSRRSERSGVTVRIPSATALGGKART